MENLIREQVKRVAASKATDMAVKKLMGEDLTELQEAREKEKQAQMKALARAAGSDTVSTGGGGGSSASEPRVIEEMMEEEDCPVCTSILAAVSEMDEPRRTRGIAEYGEFRHAVDQGEDEAVEALEGSEILQDALEDVQEVPG